MIVSIPFIAGQWSLLRNAVENDPDLRVSIPFIAGQWSLQKLESSKPPITLNTSQSPSLRGSGRFY